LGSGVTGSSLTSVGTITSGTWNGTTVATGSGGTGQTTYTNGQLLIGKTDGTLNKATLTAGTNISITNSDGGIEIATSGAGINNVVEDTTPQLGGDLDVQTHAINTSTTDGDIDLDANGAGLIQVTEFNLSQVPIVTQHDIGTATNEVPLNGMLGGMAFQDPASVSVDALTVADTADINGVLVDTSGRVIIGQADTTGVDGEADDLIVANNTTHAGITVRSGSSHNASVYFADQDAVRQGRIEYNHTGDYMRFNTNGTEQFRFGASGELGIGGATYGTSGQVLTSQGSGSAPQWATPGLGAPITASTSPAGAVYKDVPSGTKRITYVFYGVSVSSSSGYPLLRLGTSSAWVTSGYKSANVYINAGSGIYTQTNGWAIWNPDAGISWSGTVTITNTDNSSLWAANWTGAYDTTSVYAGGGTVNVSNVTRVALIVGGIGNFDGGTIGIYFE
jgi:hypothetical protein